MSNPARQAIRDATSALGHAVAQTWGELATYSHEGGTPVLIYVVPFKDELSDQGSGDADVDVTLKSFQIARQANWPPVHTATTGDEIVFEGHKWQIDKVEGDSLGASYKVDTRREHATAFRGDS